MATGQKITSSRCNALTGDVTIPGDKSISHRSVILGSLAEGVTSVRGLLESDDVLRTIDALRAMGSEIHKDDQNVWHINGVGTKGLQQPKDVLDVGNSGTSARLLMGLIAGQGLTAQITGDDSLKKRPMDRVIEPLSKMDASFESTEGKLPVTIQGTATPKALTYTIPVASAQVKSAILLAGLNAKGTTTVIETMPTRDHTENMLRSFGAKVSSQTCADGALAVSLRGPSALMAQNIHVPGDPSSAAFLLVGALLSPGSNVVLRNVGINPRRTGLIDVLRLMGAKIRFQNERMDGGEPVADIEVLASALHGIDVPEYHTADMIDEYPVLAVAAACAKGITRMRGLSELRVKESDRLTLMAKGLAACGAKVAVEGNDLIVDSIGQPPHGGALIETAMDHRIAMSFLTLGLRTPTPVTVKDGQFIATSFPDFIPLMNKLGARIVAS